MAFKPRYFKNIWAGLKQLTNVGIFPTIPGEGVPVNGPTGTGAKFGGKGQQYVNILTGIYYINTGTAASPVWSPAAGASLELAADAESSRLRKPETPVSPPKAGTMEIKPETKLPGYKLPEEKLPEVDVKPPEPPKSSLFGQAKK
jgi:hypothetical protein